MTAHVYMVCSVEQKSYLQTCQLYDFSLFFLVYVNDYNEDQNGEVIDSVISSNFLIKGCLKKSLN